MASVGKPRSFQVAFPDEDLSKLQARLDDVQLPDEEIVPDANWDYGSDLGKMKKLVNDWKQGCPAGADGRPTTAPDGVATWWRGVEKRLNK